MSGPGWGLVGHAADRLREVFLGQVRVAVAAIATDQPEDRAALVSSQLLGMALCRYVLKLPGLAAAAPGLWWRGWARPCSYLTAPLPGASAEP